VNRSAASVKSQAKTVLQNPKRSPEASTQWAIRFRRPAKDFERLSRTKAGLQLVAIPTLAQRRMVTLLSHAAYHPLSPEYA
jgi:hypothetical protein